jgi:hypothetical protein
MSISGSSDKRTDHELIERLDRYEKRVGRSEEEGRNLHDVLVLGYIFAHDQAGGRSFDFSGSSHWHSRVSRLATRGWVHIELVSANKFGAILLPAGEKVIQELLEGA